MSTNRWFGTDGIRGHFAEPPLDRCTVTALGTTLAAALVAQGRERPLVVLGGDPRASTPALCSWLASGLRSGGARLRYAGTISTPGVAWLARHLGAVAGIAVSASHNRHPDNGIKLIGGDGFKWSEEAETALEATLRAALAADQGPGDAPDEALGEPEPGLAARYLDALAATLPGAAPLAGLQVVLDAAHGAASALAAPLFTRLGAEVELLFASPDGVNINAGCGSTHPEAAAAVVRRGGRLGIAFDGDADRAVLIDEQGEVRDGDAILYLWARELRRHGGLEPPTIVATSMSNLGLERALAAEGIAVERCDVGDRAVVATLLARGLRLGGEQSGHIVNLGLATTGDGLLTALAMARLVAASGEPLSALLTGFRRFPQVLRNVRVRRKQAFAELPAVTAAAREVESQLGAEGRLVLRYSGTEPLARIMIEGPEQDEIDAMAATIAVALEESLG